jgi:hypothetical protein
MQPQTGLQKALLEATEPIQLIDLVLLMQEDSTYFIYQIKKIFTENLS